MSSSAGASASARPAAADSVCRWPRGVTRCARVATFRWRIYRAYLSRVRMPCGHLPACVLAICWPRTCRPANQRRSSESSEPGRRLFPRRLPGRFSACAT
jgi:hypothetical protein